MRRWTCISLTRLAVTTRTFTILTKLLSYGHNHLFIFTIQNPVLLEEGGNPNLHPWNVEPTKSLKHYLSVIHLLQISPKKKSVLLVMVQLVVKLERHSPYSNNLYSRCCLCGHRSMQWPLFGFPFLTPPSLPSKGSIFTVSKFAKSRCPST